CLSESGVERVCDARVRLLDQPDAIILRDPSLGDRVAFIRRGIVDQQQFPVREGLCSDTGNGGIERGSGVVEREEDGDARHAAKLVRVCQRDTLVFPTRPFTMEGSELRKLIRSKIETGTSHQQVYDELQGQGNMPDEKLADLI